MLLFDHTLQVFDSKGVWRPPHTKPYGRINEDAWIVDTIGHMEDKLSEIAPNWLETSLQLLQREVFRFPALLSRLQAVRFCWQQYLASEFPSHPVLATLSSSASDVLTQIPPA